MAFFSAVDIDSVLRKEVFDKCVTPSQPEGINQEGKSWTMDELVKQVGTELMGPDGKPVETRDPFQGQSEKTTSNGTQASALLFPERKLWLEMQMCSDKEELVELLQDAASPISLPTRSTTFPKVRENVIKGYY